ncbi:exopolyphosphatase [Opitutaceae bacterium]
MSSGPVAIIDIGSNSIKLLVAERAPDGTMVSRLMHTVDARISAGISREHPRLSESGMATGLAAIEDLVARAARFAPTTTVMVATSAVRDAENGAEFRARAQAATGIEIRILSGEEEANLIGRGLTADPALTGLKNFYVFDLGGGSLECLAFQNRRMVQAVSLPLGCVRLTERFVPDATAPLAPEARTQIMDHTRAVLAQAGFAFSLPDATAVFAGGSMTTLRAVLGARNGQSLKESPTMVGVAELRSVLDCLANLPLAARQEVPGLPSARADVFPAALATLLAIAEAGNIPVLQHSFYNLRWGLAAELLEG